MRLTDDRYSRDWRRMELAVRMIGHEARTGTIRQWTGLSDDRIRKLYRTYLESTAATTPVRRHRGKTPTQTGYFLRNRELRRHAALLAGIYTRLGLLDLDSATGLPVRRGPPLAWAPLALTAYEAYLDLCPAARISFEHGSQLLNALWIATELDLAPCCRCSALMLVDRLRRSASPCPFCEAAALGGSPNG